MEPELRFEVQLAGCRLPTVGVIGDEVTILKSGSLHSVFTTRLYFKYFALAQSMSQIPT